MFLAVDELRGMDSGKELTCRVFDKDATGFRSEGGHPFIDVTDKPFPCILEGRPVYIMVIWESAEAAESGRCLRSTQAAGDLGEV